MWKRHWPIGARSASENLSLVFSGVSLDAPTLITTVHQIHIPRGISSLPRIHSKTTVSSSSIGALSNRSAAALAQFRKSTLFAKMLRRPPTAIGLNNEDLLKFEEKRLAKKEAQAVLASSNQQRGKATEAQHGAEQAKPRAVQDRIMGGSGR